MSKSTHTHILTAVVILSMAAFGAGCAKKGPQPEASPTPDITESTSATPTPTSGVSATPTPSQGTVYGPVWPLEPRTLTGGAPPTVTVLKAIRTGLHDTYDRLVFDFSGRYGTVRVRYVPIVHEDGSDQTVPLLGNADLQVIIDGAYAGWAGQKPAYTGPYSVTPGLPALKQVTISGDFENVLSFGIGVDRVAGFQVMRMTGPDRLVIDIAHLPQWQMWPDTSQANAEAVQRSFDQGSQPWRGDVVAYFGRQVYGWANPYVARISGTDEYWVSEQNSLERIHVRQVWPFARTHAYSIAEIADVR
jgi:hypothetical protein